MEASFLSQPSFLRTVGALKSGAQTLVLHGSKESTEVPVVVPNTLGRFSFMESRDLTQCLRGSKEETLEGRTCRPVGLGLVSA